MHPRRGPFSPGRPMGAGDADGRSSAPLFTTTETSGGLTLRMTITATDSGYVTRAEWGGRSLRMVGEASSRRDAELQLDIYRTVRAP
jgi:hypothetical protein